MIAPAFTVNDDEALPYDPPSVAVMVVISALVSVVANVVVDAPDVKSTLVV